MNKLKLPRLFAGIPENNLGKDPLKKCAMIAW